MKHLMIFLSVVLSLAPFARSQPLADLVPPDAVIYVGFRGAADLGPGYDNSRLKAFLDASQMRQVVEEVIPAMLEKLGKEDRDFRQFSRLLAKLGKPLWKYPGAFYFCGVDVEAKPFPLPKLALICQAGAESAELQQFLSDLLEKEAKDAPFPIHIIKRDKLVGIAVGFKDENAALAKPGASLKESAAFLTSLRQAYQVQSSASVKDAAVLGASGKNLSQVKLGDSTLALWIDVEAGAKLIEAAAEAEPEAKKLWTKARDIIGLASVKRMVFVAGIEGRDWVTRAFIDAPGPRTGLVATLMDDKPLSDQLLKAIPASATMAGACKLDLAALFAAGKAGVVAVEPGSKDMLDQQLAEVSKLIGMDLEKDLLASFGSDWAWYNNPKKVGPGLLGIVLVNRLADPIKAQKCLASLQKRSQDAMHSLSPDISIKFRQLKDNDVVVNYLAFPGIAPSWTIRDGNLIIGLYPEVVLAAAKTQGREPSILEAPGFVALQKQVGQATFGGFSYFDLPKSVELGYQDFLPISRLLLGAADLMNVDAPATMLPSLEKLLEIITPTGTFVWSDKDGWHAVSRSAFPASELFAGIGILGSAQLVPVMAAIAVPAMATGRARAHEVRSAAQLRGIGVAIITYSTDNKDALPANLAVLVEKEVLTPHGFMHPSAQDEVVPEDKKELAAWARANKAWVMVTKAKKMTDVGADDILVHESFDLAQDDRVAVLFGDGHVESLTVDEVKEKLQLKAKPRNGGL